ncbi:MAG: NFACT RNA binding domain-containing protein [Pyrinomonadaceae bacterium]
MNPAELAQIGTEIEQALIGREFARVFPLSPLSFAIDFAPHAGMYLFVTVERHARAAYLIRRKLKELERASVHSTPFVIQLRRTFSGTVLSTVVVEGMALTLGFTGQTLDGVKEIEYLRVDLSPGRSNVYIMRDPQEVLTSLREPSPPANRGPATQEFTPISDDNNDEIPKLEGRSLSDVLDERERASAAEKQFDVQAASARKKISTEIARKRRLIKNLESDLAAHGDADQWKRFGDLILANLSTLRHDGGCVVVTDYFDPEQPAITIEIDENATPKEAAESFFKRYTKARNAADAIAERMIAIRSEIAALETRRADLESAIAGRDQDALAEYLPAKPPPRITHSKKTAGAKFPGMRQFVSSDGFEILVGKKATDNDYLTFRIARSRDLWLHAADYPGSHVIVRNPDRKEISNKTLTEAAQLAAFYSDARQQPKAAVHYTEKKFVNKPKRAAPGLVSLASFRTILVAPQVPVRLNEAV